MARRKRTVASSGGTAAETVTSIKYSATRKNIPLAGLESHGRVREAPPLQYQYNPHLPPVLRSASDAAATDQLVELLAEARRRALSEDEAKVLEEALKRHEPWLEWSGKRERPWFEVDPVALHMHERVSTQAILRTVAREDVQRDMFADPQQDYAKAVQFYRHDVDWANRMILGDSLHVMASLARREDLAGKVQMVYVDPPYGISFISNFQPEIGNTQPENKIQDLSREPETIKAYRDTWTLGVHSYLTYLRDRLAIVREMLTESGSVFVQISDENIHRVRCLMDEIFGHKNFITQLTFTKKGSQSGDFVPPINEYLLWYTRDRLKALKRFRPIYAERSEVSSSDFRYCELANGATVTISQLNGQNSADVRKFSSNALFSQKRGPNDAVDLRGESYPSGGNSWKVSPQRISIIDKAERILYSSNRVRYKRYADDFAATALSNVWTDLAGTPDKVYAVQTNPKIVERCMLMTTDPGDLVLDPTCGSGTTAYVAEQWGRRWIVIDTSRIAVSLAKHRLMTAKFDYYQLRELNAEDVTRNPGGTWIADVEAEGRPTGNLRTFQCKTVPHIKLQSIANNTSLDPIFSKHEPILGGKLGRLNQEVAEVDDEVKAALVEKLISKHREEGANAVTDADVRRWLLPGAHPGWIKPVSARKPLKAVTSRQVEGYREKIPQGEWKEWDVPFDTDPDWPPALQEALTAYRAAWRAKMDEGERLHRRQRAVRGVGGQAGDREGRGACRRPVHDGGRHRDGRRAGLSHRWCARGAGSLRLGRRGRAGRRERGGAPRQDHPPAQGFRGGLSREQEHEVQPARTGDRGGADPRGRRVAERGGGKSEGSRSASARRSATSPRCRWRTWSAARTGPATMTWPSPGSGSTRRLRRPSRAAAIRTCACTWR